MKWQNSIGYCTLDKKNQIIDRSINQSITFVYFQVNVKYDLIKETGPAHCKQFEVRLTLAEEAYIGNGTSIKRAQQDGMLKSHLRISRHFFFFFSSC